jgi:lipoprotein-anchoring transpeptidase ErfK/SrfK
MAGAAGARSERSVGSVEARAAGEPVMAIVSLRRQQITIYDAEGWILQAPVSSGQSGRETPAGIFSVIQKEAEHYSNLYDDASMPHMQRLTWSGIALHGGVVPGHPASHGCIRLPYGFAERLFDMTSLGMRVIVAPADVAPVSIVHPALFQPKADAGAVAAARAAEAEEATKKADEARLVVFKASRVAAQAMVPVRVAENLKLRAEAQLEASERALASASSAEAREQAEDARAKAAALAMSNFRRDWRPPKPNCNPNLMRSGQRAKPRPQPRPRVRRRARRPARPRETSSRCRSSSAARPSTFTSVRALNQSSTSPSQSETRIVQSARMSILPRSTLAVISTCDGAWSRG